MALYKSRKWRTEWQQIKHNAQLSDKLFKKGLGKDMDAADAAYKKFIAAPNVKAWAAPLKQMDTLRLRIGKTLGEYQKIVSANGADRAAKDFLIAARTEFCQNQLSDRTDKVNAKH